MRKIIFTLTIFYTITSFGQNTIGFKTKNNGNIDFEVSMKNIYVEDIDNTAKLNQEKVITVGKDFKIIEKTRKSILNNTATLDISQLTKGIYILKIIDNTGSAESHQVVVN